jgi:protein-S-isoprenylcysteine O-methyltransferase Ste14
MLGFGGTLLSLLFRPGAAGTLPWLLAPGDCVQVAGLAAIGGALLSINKSIGIVAANRGIRQGGFYRFVRHPLYASELLFFCGYAMSNQSLANCLTLVAALAVQYGRIIIEEDFLSADPVYARYRSKTRYRLIPGIL